MRALWSDRQIALMTCHKDSNVKDAFLVEAKEDEMSVLFSFFGDEEAEDRSCQHLRTECAGEDQLATTLT